MPKKHTLRPRELSLEVLIDDEFALIPGKASEQRAQISTWEKLRNTGLQNYIIIDENESGLIQVSVNEEPPVEISLKDKEKIKDVLHDRNILIDISGFPHHIWAPILRAAYELKIQTRVLYSEPQSYNPHKSPASSTLFDLSKEFGGLSPLPGFAQLSGPLDESKCIFVALLGFEGNRPRSLIYNFDPPPKVIPIVGVPGFQIEFPSFTIKCNKELLDEFQAYVDIRYAHASSPFDAYKQLKDIRETYPDHYMYIAPVGTKPHGLGAILFSITNPGDTEILFDHPVRKVGRTDGLGAIHIYDFGMFDGY